MGRVEGCRKRGKAERYRERRRIELGCVEEWDHPHSHIHVEGSECGVCRTCEWDEEISIGVKSDDRESDFASPHAAPVHSRRMGRGYECMDGSLPLLR